MNKHKLIKYSYEHFVCYYKIEELKLDNRYSFIAEIECCNITTHNILNNISIDTLIGIKRFLACLEIFFIDFYFDTQYIIKLQEKLQDQFIIDNFLDSNITFNCLMESDTKSYIFDIMKSNCEKAERRNLFESSRFIRNPIFFKKEFLYLL